MIDEPLINRFQGSRFLFVLGQYHSLGGSERQAIILADYLKQHVGCHVDFLAWQGEGRPSEELRVRGIKPWVYPLKWNRNPISKAWQLRKLARFIKTNIRPDYLLPYIGFNCKIIGMIWRRTGATYTWWNQRDEGRGIYGSKLEKRMLEELPDVVSNSFEGRDFLVRKFGIPSDRVRVINNGIELPAAENSHDWRGKLNLGADDILITMVANLTKFKDHTTLLKAFAQLRQTDVGANCHLVLAGRHSDAVTELKVLAFDLGLSGCVQMIGSVEDVSGLLRATDLVVHSSFTEGCPNSVLEAMSHGRCVVGTDVSGLRQAVGDEMCESVLAPPNDANKLAAILERFAGDRTLRAEFGCENLKRIESEFSVSGLAENVLRGIQTRCLG